MQIHRQGRQGKPARFSICWLIGVFACFALSGLVRGQGVSVLHNFGDGTVTGDGFIPNARVIMGSDGNFYGTSLTGGSNGQGTVFKATPQGAITILHKFNDGSVTNDGANPSGRLVPDSSGNFYGTTSSGGSAHEGTVFKISSGVLTILHHFGDGSVTHDGIGPVAGLILGLDGNLYGTTPSGGSANKGTVFEVTTQGVTTIIHNFGDGSVSGDGASPAFGLAQDAQGNFYGTTAAGGTAGLGVVYTINSQNQLSILHTFAQPSSISFLLNGSFASNGVVGYVPNSRLLLASDGNLYGSTAFSGEGYGTIYKMTTQGQITYLHYFGDGSVANDGVEATFGENNLFEASQPVGGGFYGTTSLGGSAGNGVVFKMTFGGQFTILHSFADGTVTSDGAVPRDGVALDSAGIIYGTTSEGGSKGDGAFYKIVPAVPEITSPLVIKTGVGLAVNYQITATQGAVTYAASGLPGGLNFSSSTGVISGMATATGTSNVTLTVTNGAGPNSSTLVITVFPPPVITSVLTEIASTATTFGYQISATNSPTSFAATGLPTGLAIDTAKGMILGTPTQTGLFSVTVSAINVAGQDNRILNLFVSSTAPTFSQEYLALKNFNDGTVAGEGSFPGAMIQGKDGILYGVTAQGGANNAGTIFSLSPAGDAAVVFSNFGGANGTTPQGIVQGTDGNFYVTTQTGGSASKGTILKITTAGVVTLLHTFGDASVVNDGANPQCGVILGQDGNFYGTTQNGGTNGQGTIFKMTPLGAVMILYSFGAFVGDGEQPVTALVENGVGTFYGTTLQGGTANDGSVFVLYPNGNESTLHSFGDGTITDDGQMPKSPLLNVGGTFYGTTYIGGTLQKGTLYSISQAGAVTILHNFGDGSVVNDGINPTGALVSGQTGNLIFGTTQNGGVDGGGAAYEYTAQGVTLLHSFDDANLTDDGITPLAGLVLGTDGNLYGTTMAGGVGSGTAFAILTNLAPPTGTTFPPTYWMLTGTLPAGMMFDSASGTISGMPLPSAPFGSYVVMITHISNGVPGTPQSISINLGETFGTWMTGNTMLGGTQNGSPPDGVPLLLKYLCDINPSALISASDRAALPTLGEITPQGGSGTYLTLTYRQYSGAAGVTVTLQSSADLQTWTNVLPANLLSQQMSMLPNGDAIMQVGVKTTGAKQFIRLNVTSP